MSYYVIMNDEGYYLNIDTRTGSGVVYNPIEWGFLVAYRSYTGTLDIPYLKEYAKEYGGTLKLITVTVEDV